MNKDRLSRKLMVEKLKRFRYPVLVLLLGVVLMLIPFGKEESAETPAPTPVVQEVTDYKTQTERQLKTVLEQVAGAGKVTVMLSLKSGSQTVYQTDTTSSSQTAEGNTANSAQQSTVLISKDDIGQEPAIVKTIYPLFRGAVVVCQGADDPAVALRILQIVESITGLGSERITIAKMK